MEGDAAHHLGRVLRAQAGQVYELSDGHSVWLGKIGEASRDRIEFTLLEEIPSCISPLQITLLLSVVKFDAMEWALEKATELGVSRVVPLAAERSEKALLGALARRALRWKKILRGAAEQSRRLAMPVLDELARPEKAFSTTKADIKVILSERPDTASLRSVLRARSGKSVTLAIGPEGGWTDAEFVAAEKAGFQRVSLGHLILRTETAVIAALASVNFALAES